MPTPAPIPPPPSPWVQRFAPLVRPGGPVLDLACGSGRHLRYFQARGHTVTGIDIDPGGVADLAGVAGVTLRAVDLEAEGMTTEDLRAALGGPYAAIIVCHYLHRPLLPLLPACLEPAGLEPGGLLLYETFAQGNQRLGRPSRPAFLLRSGELLAVAAAADLTVVAFEQGIVTHPKPAVLQRLAARNPGPPPADLHGDPEPAPLPPAGAIPPG